MKKLKEKKLPKKLPKFLHKYFWDIDQAKLIPTKQSFYIRERLMDKGDLKAIKWLFKYSSKQDLKKVYLNSRGISKFSRPFWAAYLKIYPLETLCSQKEFLQSQKTAWPY